MKEQRRMGHTVSWLTAHIVWVTKITDKMIQDYLEHHRNPSNEDGEDTIILE